MLQTDTQRAMVARVAAHLSGSELARVPILQRGRDGRMFRVKGGRPMGAGTSRDRRFALPVDVTGTTGLTGPNTPGSAGDASPLLEGIRTEFLGTYLTQLEKTESMWKRILFRTVQANSSYYQYTYPETAPYPVRQPRGTVPAAGGIRYRGNRIDIHAFASRVFAHRDDIEDDQTGTVLQTAQRAGRNFATLMDRIAIQLILAQTDTDLLPAVGTAADGVGMYSATDGDGGDRFGISGGNIVSLGTTPDHIDIQAWIYDIMARWRRMTDTQGQPLFDPELIKQGVMLIHGPALNEEMAKALRQKMVFQNNVALDAAAAPSNIIIDGGVKVETYESARITDNSVRAFLLSDEIERPAIWAEREAMYEVYADEPVSDYSRDTQQAYMQFRSRLGAGYHLPFSTISGGAGA